VNIPLLTFNAQSLKSTKVQVILVNAFTGSTSKCTLKSIRTPTHSLMWKGTPPCRVVSKEASPSTIRLMYCIKPSNRTKQCIKRNQSIHPLLRTRTLVMFKCLAYLLVFNTLLFSKVFISLLGIYQTFNTQHTLTIWYPWSFIFSSSTYLVLKISLSWVELCCTYSTSYAFAWVLIKRRPDKQEHTRPMDLVISMSTVNIP
jgi:hypothetical protein